ncbi:MAG TPA: hypothetical protein HA272_02955 [Methanoregula sp.]|nr:hypothetical protein [Methanoregula sp.]
MELPSYHNKNTRLLLEFAVPILSFGGAAVAILADLLKIPLDIHYPAFGCVAASVILAYLAWIRPRKDIVAISTPIYAILFFLIPAEFSVGVILMLLYAASLTILLIRLKRRFGSASPVSGGIGEGPLFDYMTRTGEAMESVPSDTAADAGRIVIRFAHGEYEMAAALARKYLQEPGNDVHNVLTTAFGIIADHDAQCRSAPALACKTRHFSPDTYPLLFHPAPDGSDTEQESAVALDNALLLLYAVAMVFASEEQKEQVRSFHPFAEKLAGLK